MKIYISGKITGLPFPEVEEKFYDAKDLLESLDFEVINPLENGLTQSHSWNEHMVRDIEMLLDCDAIFMLDNWQTSKGADIEYHIACKTGKDVWFESSFVRNQTIVMQIQKAIHEVTGMRFREYTTRSRKRDAFFCRMIFVHHCRKHKMRLIDIAKYVHRDHSSMLHLLNKYKDEVKFNPNFRMMAEQVENILNESK